MGMDSDSNSDSEDILRTILLNMRYVNEPTIERFLNNYRLGKEFYEKKPKELVYYMQHMFGPGQGLAAFELFKGVKGK